MVGLSLAVTLLCLLILPCSLVALFFRSLRPKAKWSAAASAVGLVVGFISFGVSNDRNVREKDIAIAAKQTAVINAPVGQRGRGPGEAAETPETATNRVTAAQTAESALYETYHDRLIHSPTGNPMHDTMLELSDTQRAEVLGMGAGCTGTFAFFRGMKKGTNEAFWSVRCTDGRTFGVMLDPAEGPDGGPSGKVLECSLLAAINAGDCFTKFSNSN